MLSAVVLSHNEEKNMQRCLSSLSFCDEILVIDDFSTDQTVAIAQGLGSQVIQHKLSNDFAAQRNFGLSQAKGEWVLFVDADEEVTQDLAKEIQEVMKKEGEFSAYYLKRRDFWWGRELCFGEVAKVRSQGLIRLVKKGSGQWVRPVHEELQIIGLTGRLNGYLNHYPHHTVKDFLQEVNFYSSMRAKELLAKGKQTSVFSLIFFPLGKFIWTYFLKLGFLDGPAGFAYAFFMSFHSFLVRAKLYQYRHINSHVS